MTSSDFLKILEAFPGRRELQRYQSAEQFVSEKGDFDFRQVTVAMKQPAFFVDIPNYEEIWFKFISFLVLSAEYGESELVAKNFLKVPSKQKTSRICSEFNEMFYGSVQVIQDIAGIEPSELIEFAKSEEAIFL